MFFLTIYSASSPTSVQSKFLLVFLPVLLLFPVNCIQSFEFRVYLYIRGHLFYHSSKFRSNSRRDERSPNSCFHRLNVSYHLLFGKFRRLPMINSRLGPGGSLAPALFALASGASTSRRRITVPRTAPIPIAIYSFESWSL
jgi:hypothetical protein